MRFGIPRYIGDGILKTSLQKKEIDQEGAGTLATTLDDVQKVTVDEEYGVDTRKYTKKLQQFKVERVKGQNTSNTEHPSKSVNFSRS